MGDLSLPFPSVFLLPTCTASSSSASDRDEMRPKFNSTANAEETLSSACSNNVPLQISPILRSSSADGAESSCSTSNCSRSQFARRLQKFKWRGPSPLIRQGDENIRHSTTIDDANDDIVAVSCPRGTLESVHEPSSESIPSVAEQAIIVPDTSTAPFTQSSTEQSDNNQSITNPFESRLLESLHTNTFSPSVFAKVTSPKNSPSTGEFRWSIEQLAILHPAEIDEHDTSQYALEPNPTMEAKYHKAIEHFWATQKQIAPSPDAQPDSAGGDGSMGNSESNRRRGRPVVTDESPMMRRGMFRTASFSNASKRSRQTQTLLTFPPNLNLELLLGSCFRYNEPDNEEEEGEAEQAAFEANLSINTLRRKLFSSEDEVSASQMHNDSGASTEYDDRCKTPPLNNTLNRSSMSERGDDYSADVLSFGEGPRMELFDFSDDVASSIRQQSPILVLLSPGCSPIK